MMQQELTDELRNALQREHDRLTEELKAIAKPNSRIPGDWNVSYPQFDQDESGSHSSADEEADEVEEYEAVLEAEHSLETQLLQVNRALERIAQGHYGLCARCNKPIPIERLRANPSAEYDIEHEPKNTAL